MFMFRFINVVERKVLLVTRVSRARRSSDGKLQKSRFRTFWEGANRRKRNPRTPAGV